MIDKAPLTLHALLFRNPNMLERGRCFRPHALVALLALSLLPPALCRAAAPKANRPNFIIVLADDLGYGDLGCYGAKGIKTPNLDRMAQEGIRFLDFYVASSVCSPSRAALLTGCYPQRVGLPVVLEADSAIGLNSHEETLPELLAQAGYATGLVGKWHLGDRPQFLPTRHGFQEYFGLPYSNDMWPGHPTKKTFFPDLPLMEGERIIGYNPDQSQLTRMYTEHAIAFIEKHRDKPFFLELAHTMPHVPLHVGPPFLGKSQQGLYGDAVQEIDWSMGEIFDALKRLDLDERTMVVFFSDNGPWLTYGNDAGSAGPLRDGKTSSFEGGFRVPCLMRWPGQVAAGRTSLDLVTAMDILPTMVSLAGARHPRLPIDGKNIWPIASGQPHAQSPHQTFFYYNAWALEAVRSGNWKLMLPATRYAVAEPGHDGFPGKQEWVTSSLALYDLQNDVGEQSDVALEHPDIVEKLLTLVAEARDDLGDGVIRVNPEKKDFFQARRLFKIPGKNVRQPGT